ncbi:centrosomal protein of 68 kDa [Petaurus breviceps papuanus]|uniref:centrosomal protein of 68 kDa n=1 Tax=Petaurus breviceps papuanus TaxID=3040969 RepID=UPI0036D7C1EF
MGPELGRVRSLSSMALSEEKTLAETESEAETVLDGNVKHHGGCNSQELETDCSMALGSVQHFLDAGGGKCVSLGEEEELTNRKAMPDHIPVARGWKKHHTDKEGETTQTSEKGSSIKRSEPAYSHLLPEDRTGTGTGDLFLEVGAQMEEELCLDSPGLAQSVADPLARTLSSGEVADDEDDHSSFESPRVHGPGQQPYNSSSSFSLRWKSLLNLDLSNLSLSSHSFPTSPTPNSFLRQREKTGSQNLWPPKSSSLEPTASCLPSGLLSSALSPMPAAHGMPCLASCSGGAVTEASRRRSSFQTDYWACVLPNSLPPSPDRHSPLWNPNKEYEDLLDYTYPLKPKAQLPKHVDSHVLTDTFLHDSGVDLDSFSLSPENTLKSPATLSHDCLPTEPDVQLPPEPRNCDDRFSAVVSETQGSFRLAASGQFTSTPKASSRHALQNEKEQHLINFRKSRPMERCLEAHLPSPGEWSRGSSFSTLTGQNGGSSDLQCLSHDVPMESGWKTQEDIEIEEEYLALPPRLTQVSSLSPYLSTVQIPGSQPSVATEGQGLPAASGDKEPAPLLHHSKRHSTWEDSRGKRGTADRDCCTQIPHFQFQKLDREGDANILISQDPGGPANRLKTISSFRKMLAGLAYPDLKPEGQHLKKEKDQERESLLQCVKIFCCYLEELICWLYKVAEVTDNLIPPKSNLASLKSSLQLYRQFKKDIAEHQSLTESVLQKGEILLQCLLENASVLKDALGLIARQSSELEDHAEHLYDSVLAALDMMAGNTSGPDSKPATCERI